MKFLLAPEKHPSLNIKAAGSSGVSLYFRPAISLTVSADVQAQLVHFTSGLNGVLLTVLSKALRNDNQSTAAEKVTVD